MPEERDGKGTRKEERVRTPRPFSKRTPRPAGAGLLSRSKKETDVAARRRSAGKESWRAVHYKRKSRDNPGIHTRERCAFVRHKKVRRKGIVLRAWSASDCRRRGAFGHSLRRGRKKRDDRLGQETRWANDNSGESQGGEAHQEKEKEKNRAQMCRTKRCKQLSVQEMAISKLGDLESQTEKLRGEGTTGGNVRVA